MPVQGGERSDELYEVADKLSTSTSATILTSPDALEQMGGMNDWTTKDKLLFPTIDVTNYVTDDFCRLPRGRARGSTPPPSNCSPPGDR
eukprot:295038-Heterocapsa_arctica.AAC.1